MFKEYRDTGIWVSKSGKIICNFYRDTLGRLVGGIPKFGTDKGYIHFTYRRKKHHVHVVVGRTYYPKYDYGIGTGKYCIHHINGDRSDNRLENLMPMENSEHLKLENLGNVNALVKTLDDERMGRLRNEGLSYKKIGNLLGCDAKTVMNRLNYGFNIY